MSKRALLLVFAVVSIIVGWMAGIVFVFVVPLMMISWVIVTLTWTIWGAFTFFVCQTAELHSICGSNLQARKAS